MPAFEVLQHRDTLAFERLCHERAWLSSAVAAKQVEGRNYVDIVMSIDSLREPAKRSKFVHETIHIELIHRSLTLTQSIHVHDGKQIRRFVISRDLCRFPNRPFCAFAISQQNVSVEWNAIEI